MIIIKPMTQAMEIIYKIGLHFFFFIFPPYLCYLFR